MPGLTLTELTKLKSGVAAATAGGLASSWTPDRINEVISNIRGLVKEAMAMRQGIAGMGTTPAAGGTPGPDHPLADTPGQGQLMPAGQAVTMPQLAAMAKRIFESLEAQGYADKTPFEALQSVTLTIGQIKGFLP